MDTEKEWDELGKLAFRRREKVGDIFKQLSRLIQELSEHSDSKWLGLIKDWLLVPFTLWPLDIAGLAGHVCDTVERGQRLHPRVRFILEEIHPLPNAEARGGVAEYERLVEQGQYEPLIRTPAKYGAEEKELLKNGRLR